MDFISSTSRPPRVVNLPSFLAVRKVLASTIGSDTSMLIWCVADSEVVVTITGRIELFVIFWISAAIASISAGLTDDEPAAAVVAAAAVVVAAAAATAAVVAVGVGPISVRLTVIQVMGAAVEVELSASDVMVLLISMMFSKMCAITSAFTVESAAPQSTDTASCCLVGELRIVCVVAVCVKAEKYVTIPSKQSSAIAEMAVVCSLL